MRLHVLVLLALFSVRALCQQQIWIRSIPDQSDSQEVDVGSIENIGAERVAWTRSKYFRPGEVPAGLDLPEGTMQYVRFAAKCGDYTISARVIEVRYVSKEGAVLHSMKEELSDKFPDVDNLFYEPHAPGIICAASLAKERGKPFPWPMSKSELHAFVMDNQ